MEEDGFQMVSRKRGRRRLANNNTHSVQTAAKLPLLAEAEPEEKQCAKLLARIAECRAEVVQSEFYLCFVKTLRRSLEVLYEPRSNSCDFSTSGDGRPPIPPSSPELDSASGVAARATLEDLVCYGLGNFSVCVIARYQLALLLCLQCELRLSHVYVFDPIFLNFEKAILTKLNILLIDRNEEGKRKVDTRTLFYLPHCGRALYNNLLWANWGPGLSRVIVVGNSFTRLFDTVLNGILEARWTYLLRAVAHAEEYSVANSFRFRDIFNDLSIHVFPAAKVAAFPEEYWDDCKEPVYDTSDIEIITNEMMQRFKPS